MNANRLIKHWAVLTNFVRTKSTHLKDLDLQKNVLFGGTIKEPPGRTSLGQLIYHRLKDPVRAEKILQICSVTGAKMTTQQFLKESVAVAEALTKKDIKKGDFILVVGNNSLNMNIALTGIFILGAVPVPISKFANPDDLKNIVKKLQPKFYICSSQTLFTIRRLVNSIIGEAEKDKTLLLNDCKYLNTNLLCFSEFIRGKGENWESFKPVEVKNPKEELAVVMKPIVELTGGRGVQLTHANLLAVINRYEATRLQQVSSDIILMVQKTIWMSGLYTLLMACCFGSKLIVMSEFDEELFLKAVEKYRVTTCYLYPSKIWQIQKHALAATYDLSSVRCIYAIGFGIPRALIKGMKDKLGITIKPSYALTEMAGIVIESEGACKEDSVGRLVPMTYAKVASLTKRQKYGPNERGELCFKGPTLMKGYVDDEKAERELIDEEGFARSGVYGYYDNDGEFYVVDLISQLIKYKDVEVSPLEIEGIIKSHDAVKDCVVGGIPHPTDGYHPAAFVVHQPGKLVTAEEIEKFVESKLPEHKHLRGGVIFIPKVPRSRETGMIKRTAIKNVLSKYQLVTDPVRLKQMREAAAEKGTKSQKQTKSSKTTPSPAAESTTDSKEVKDS